MFGISFAEILVILVVALIVVGPERLPRVARTLGHLWGRGQRYINTVKADIARDMAAEDLRKLREQVQQEADKVQLALRQTANAAEQQAREFNDAVASAVRSVEAVASSTSVQEQLELSPPQTKVPPTD
jgi:sec-independent protein translocase protein TatB